MNKIIKNMFITAVSFSLFLTGCTGGGGTQTQSSSSGEEQSTVIDHDTPTFDLNRYLVPVWDDNGIAYNETAMLIRTPDDMDVFDVQLAYPIDEIISVRDFSLDTEYVKGVDYDLEGGILKIKGTGRLYDIAIAYKEYFIEKYNGNNGWPCVEGEGAQLKTEAEFGNQGLTAYQIAVTYKHSATWDGVKPADKSATFAKLSQKLASGSQVNVVCLGDSISYGWTASGLNEVFLRPFCPNYFTLVTNYMNYKFGNLSAYNFSVGGMSANWGCEAKQISDVVSKNPDLLILAFGMNDGSGQTSYSPDTFYNNIKKTIDGVRESCPDCEIVLVSTMLPNAEVGYHPGNSILGNQKNYIPKLMELESSYTGIAVANVTEIHEHLLQRKNFRDMSANNINHPNDYVHRVYAQVVLQTVFGKIERVTIPE